MALKRQLTAIIEREGDGYAALCPEIDVASQGTTIEEARRNLAEAIELFFETADPSEVEGRLHEEVFVTRVEVTILVRLRIFSGRELCPLLAEHGFEQVRQRGSRAVMWKRIGGTTVTVPVPLHDEIRVGTLQSVIRHSSLPRESFERQ